MKTKTYGTSIQGIPLTVTTFGEDTRSGSCDLFVFAGVHGDETEAITIGQRFFEWCQNNDGLLKSLKRKVLVMPQANPDGAKAVTRSNARGVDLNRNMNTLDWTAVISNPRYNPGPKSLSEPESQALVSVMETEKPRCVVSLHTFDPQINVNGPADKWGKVLSQMTGYPMNHDIGYPTPGSFGTWAGWERKIPTITFEIRRDMDKKSPEWDKCLNALISISKADPDDR